MKGMLTFDEMQDYVVKAERKNARQKAENEVLHDELASSESVIEGLQLKLQKLEATILRQQQMKRVSEFAMEKIESGGTVRVIMQKEPSSEDETSCRRACERGGCCKIELMYDSGGGYEEYQTECRSVQHRPNVFLEKTSSALSIYSVHLSKCEPCPSPVRFDKKGVHHVSDAALTMCAMWERWTDHHEMYKRRERRTAKKRKTRVKTAVKEAFGNSAIPEDSSLFQAVCGFIEGSQDGKDDDKWYVADYIQRLDKTEHGGKATRATKNSRKELLSQMVTYMYDGDVVKQLERNVIRKKRFSTVKLARVSDMNSTFNPSALGAIASCEGGKKKGEMGLLCAESTLRRCMDQVLLLAKSLGFFSLPLEHDGTIWSWGDSNGLMRTAINRYVKTMYYDACCDKVTETAPWIVCLTGDGVRTSQRGTFVTVIGPKLADPRLVQQTQTMKTMCQSREMYTPAVAGYADEKKLMPYFHLLVSEFLRIEEQRFCVVNDRRYPVYLKITVIADLSFLHKYTGRGGSSHSSTCFCMLCGALRNFKHHGYPGGCRDCRARGIVYNADGLQICLHYEACTSDFLEWQATRFAELSGLISDFPLTSLPAWDNVAQLRVECVKRCVGPYAGWYARISKKSGRGTMNAMELSNWIMKVTRDDATLSTSKLTGVMYCPITVVKASLTSRFALRQGRSSDLQLRLQLRGQLQLEQEYTRMALHITDDRFGPTHSSSKAISVNRIILCTLHLPMRTHEKVLTLLFQQACHNRLSKNSLPIMDDMVIIIRRIGKLKDTWSYKWNTTSSCVEKFKMHWDQSKRIFITANMDGLRAIVELAVQGKTEQGNWMLFLKQYVLFIDLLIVSRDYTESDLVRLDNACTETYKLLITHCGGKDAVTNYFHYIGAGHVTWMCREFGNIWRYRNEGVEAYNKVLSKRANMFNSSGNRGNESGKGNVLPFEVLGKWMGRSAMWQLEYANDLFTAKGGSLGASEICYDANTEIWEYNTDVEVDDDDEYSSREEYDNSQDSSDSDLDCYFHDDHIDCSVDTPIDDGKRYSFRKRPVL